MTFAVFEADLTDESSPLFPIITALITESLCAEGAPFTSWRYHAEPALNEQHSNYYRVDVLWFDQDDKEHWHPVYFSVIDILRGIAAKAVS